MPGTAIQYGILAEFDSTAAALHAAEKVRDAGFRRWDVFTPFPVHGMDRAMGLKNSKVGWFSFLGGVTGYTSGMLMIWYIYSSDTGHTLFLRKMFDYNIDSTFIRLTLPLLVPRICADYANDAIAPNDFAIAANLFY